MTHPMDETRAERPDDVSLLRGFRLQQAARATPVAEILEDPFLREALHDLVLLMEQQVPDMIGSVLLLDADGVTLHHGAAPHLPDEYCRMIDGSRVGPAAGSCGTAA
jgi:hypothetical protein